MNLTEKTVEKHTLYKGFIINLRVDDALLPDGRPCKREMVEHPGGAAVLCVEEGKVLLVRQFRYAYGEELLEIPAGKLDKGEDPAHAAARELEEETGRVAERVEKLFTLYPTPGYTNEKLHVFLAHGVHMGHVTRRRRIRQRRPHPACRRFRDDRRRADPRRKDHRRGAALFAG